jgi:hypothetical protein
MSFTARSITIRKSTPQERKDKWPPIVMDGRRIPVPKYVVCMWDDDERVVSVFGLPQGGDTREEAVFWAERCASKNGFDYVPPHGWEDIDGKLPSERPRKKR